MNITATYLGVARRGEPDTVLSRADALRYTFSGPEGILTLPLSRPAGDPFRLPNLLIHGRDYALTLEGGEIRDLAPLPFPEPAPFRNPFRGEPGKRTLKNFLLTALMPLGSALYVFGGGWSFEDTGSNAQTRALGLSSAWRSFFLSRDESYTYRDPFGDEKKADPATSFYPYGGFNEYGWAGLDCSGYVGWILYNTLEASSGAPGCVGPSTRMAKACSDRGLGTLSRPERPRPRPGDIASIRGHVWMSLGTCGDGSILILHSTPSPSRASQPGGGVQMGAVGPSEACEAYTLARDFMSRFCPEWFARYDACLKSPETYLSFPEEGGLFSWSREVLPDPENLFSLTPAELLSRLEA